MTDKDSEYVVESNEPPIALHPDMKDSLVLNGKYNDKGARPPPPYQFIKTIKFKFCRIIPDFLFGDNGAGLLWSISQTQKNPTGLRRRFDVFNYYNHNYEARVLVLCIDAPGYRNILLTISVAAFTNGWTLLVAWSFEEAGKVIESLHQLSQNKTLDPIAGLRETSDNRLRLKQLLTSLPKVSKSNAEELIQSHHSFKNILNTSEEKLRGLSGFGDKKVAEVLSALKDPLF